MAVITTYYCPGCRKEIKGLGWKGEKMNHCPHCGMFISNLNRLHIDEFNKWIVAAVIFTIMFIPVPIISVCIAILAIVLFLKRKKAKTG
jgi:hypothetical protein